MGRGVGLGDLTGNGKHHCNRMLCGGDGVAERRIHHDDAFFRGFGDIHIIYADPCAANDL